MAPIAMNEEFRHASDVARDPASVSVAAYIWMMAVALLGGVVRVIREVNLGSKTWKQIVLVFLAEMTTSLFVGVVTFFFCQAAEFKIFNTMIMVSIASYMGGRALTVFEALWKARMQMSMQGGDDGEKR